MAKCTDGNGDTWEIYQAVDGWRWNRKARNGATVGASTEAYHNRSDCIANARRNSMTCTPA
jgi:uncharacterized protein YegP (UPF0339 family)